MPSFFLKILILVLLAAIFVAAWFLQDQFFLNGDVSYYLHAAKRLWAGGSYSQDFFNPNPPLILYLYTPPLILASLLKLSIILSFRLYGFLLVLLSLVLCYSVAQKIFSKQKPLVAFFIIAVLSLSFLLLPFYHFGQRDHLLVVLTMPYFLLVALRLEEKGENLPSIFMQLMVGLFAGLGFAMKPQFLIIPLLIELYYMFRQRSLISWWRAEVLSILGLLAVLLLTLRIFYPDYVTVVLPFVLQHYYKSVGNSWQQLFLNPPALFCYASLLFCFVQEKSKPYRNLNSILLIALLGFLLSYFSQQTTFFYHILPALTLALLLLALSFVRGLRVLGLSLAALLLAALFPFLTQNYLKGLEYKEEVLAKLVSFMQTQKPQRSLMVFARWGTFGFPMVDYTASTAAQRFDCFWPVAALLKDEQKTKDFFIKMIADDLHLHQPDLVFIDSEDHSFTEDGGAFNYLEFFASNRQFREEWKAYHYLTTLDEYPRYKLLVYQRQAKRP